jgi:hypothetical protein
MKTFLPLLCLWAICVDIFKVFSMFIWGYSVDEIRDHMSNEHQRKMQELELQSWSLKREKARIMREKEVLDELSVISEEFVSMIKESIDRDDKNLIREFGSKHFPEREKDFMNIALEFRDKFSGDNL